MRIFTIITSCIFLLGATTSEAMAYGSAKFGFAVSDDLNATPFSSFYSEVIQGDFVAGATSLWNGSGTITISGIPTGATVLGAYLFYTYQDDGGGHSGNFNGTPITGTFLGSDCSSCWYTTSTTLYYADVTTLVSGNGTYTLDGFDPLGCGGDHGTQGATLIVVYCEGSEPVRSVTIYTGVWETYCSGFYHSWVHSGFNGTSPITSAKYSISIGNGQDFESGGEYVRVNGNVVSSDVDGSVPPTGGSCGNGSLWDHFYGDATPYIPGGATNVVFTVDNSAALDCWHPVLSALSLTVTDSITQTCTNGYDDPVLLEESGLITPRNGATFSVYNASGRLVYRGRNPYRLPKGIYFVVSGNWSRRILVR